MSKEKIIVYQQFTEVPHEIEDRRADRNLFNRRFGWTSELDDLEALDDSPDTLTRVIGMLTKLRKKRLDPTHYQLQNLPINGEDALLSVEGNANALDQSVSRIRFPLSEPVYRKMEGFFKEQAPNYRPQPATSTV